MDSLEAARALGRSLVPKAIRVLGEALAATKPVLAANGDVAGDVPDHAVRVRAAAEIGDRFGLPKRTELETSDPQTKFLAELVEAVKAGR